MFISKLLASLVPQLFHFDYREKYLFLATPENMQDFSHTFEMT